LGLAENAVEGEGKKKKRKGARKGAAAGAVVGGASGAWYDYDQGNQDDRTEMIADSNSSGKSSDETLYFVGEYLADKNTYDFFLTGTAEPEMITPGMIRSMLRVEIRVSSPSMWVAEAYTHIDGKEVQVQSYHFTRS